MSPKFEAPTATRGHDAPRGGIENRDDPLTVSRPIPPGVPLFWAVEGSEGLELINPKSGRVVAPAKAKNFGVYREELPHPPVCAAGGRPVIGIAWLERDGKPEVAVFDADRNGSAANEDATANLQQDVATERPQGIKSEALMGVSNQKVQSIPSDLRTTAQPVVFSRIRYSTPTGKEFIREANGGLLKRTLANGTSGTAHFVSQTTIEEIAQTIKAMTSSDVMLAGVAWEDRLPLVPQAQRASHNVARTKGDFSFPSGPGLMILDNDIPTGQSDDQFDTYAYAVPAMVSASYVVAPSSSSWIYDATSDEMLKGPGGQHYYVPVKDASDIPRALKALHQRLLLVGHGKAVITADGRALIKSPVDLAMRSPNQPAFQRVSLGPGLYQDKDPHVRTVRGDDFLFDTGLIQDLNTAEMAALETAEAALRAEVATDAQATRVAWIEAQAPRVAARTGKPIEEARAFLERRPTGNRMTYDLCPGMTIVFADGASDVGDVLAEPTRYDGKPCADPFEPDYGSGVGVAKFYANLTGGKPVIKSFAHGGQTFFLHQDLSDVDLSGILAMPVSATDHAPPCHQGIEEEPATAKAPPDFVAMAPGVLGDIARWITATAPKPQPELALAAAIAVCSTVMGRTYRSQFGNFTSLYVVMIAKSTEGKEHPQSCAAQILSDAGLGELVAGSGYTSPGAVYSTLLRTPCHLVTIDEMGKLLKFTRAKGSAHAEAAIDKLVEAFGRLNGVMQPPNYSDMTLRERVKIPPVHNPAITLLGATTPATFYGALTSDLVHDGFLGRCLVIESKQPRQLTQFAEHTEPPACVLDWCRAVHASGVFDGNLAGVMVPELPAKTITLWFAEACIELLRALEQELIDEKDAAEGERLDVLLGRTQEKAMRLAMIVAKAEDPRAQEVLPRHLEWAIEYVRHYDRSLLAAVREQRVHSEEDAKLKNVLQFIGKARELAGKVSDPHQAEAMHAGLMPRSIVMQRTHLSTKELKAIDETLTDSGRVQLAHGKNLGLAFNGLLYRLLA